MKVTIAKETAKLLLENCAKLNSYRGAICHVLCEVNDGRATLTATDGHALVRVSAKCWSGNGRFLVNQESLKAGLAGMRKGELLDILPDRIERMGAKFPFQDIPQKAEHYPDTAGLLAGAGGGASGYHVNPILVSRVLGGIAKAAPGCAIEHGAPKDEASPIVYKAVSVETREDAGIFAVVMPMRLG